MNNKIYLILILFIMLCTIVFFISYEGFTDAPPAPDVKNSPVRQDGSCSDPDQTNTYDRFDGVVFADMNIPVPFSFVDADSSYQCGTAKKRTGVNYEFRSNYFEMSNICLPLCIDGYTINPNDTTLCIASNSVCYNTPDLSSNILDSWRETCGIMKKTQLNLTSTIASISNVKDTVNSNTYSMYTMLHGLSNKAFHPTHATSNAIGVRNLRYPYLVSNYLDAYSMNSNVDFNYESLNTKKASFDTIYNSFLCDEYN